jgi:hypothetical protein
MPITTLRTETEQNRTEQNRTEQNRTEQKVKRKLRRKLGKFRMKFFCIGIKTSIRFSINIYQSIKLNNSNFIKQL